jgi:hypothetical protein
VRDSPLCEDMPVDGAWLRQYPGISHEPAESFSGSGTRLISGTSPRKANFTRTRCRSEVMRLLILYGLGEGSIKLYKQTPTMSVGYRMVTGYLFGGF